MISEEIKSLKDDRIQLARSLTSLKHRQETGKFLIEGFEAIEWALQAGIEIEFILVSNQIKTLPESCHQLKSYAVTDGLLKKVTDTHYLISCVAVGCRKGQTEETDFLVVLDDLQDYGNIGTIVRTCQAFGVRTVISSKRDFDLFQRKTVTASRGKVFTTSLLSFSTPDETVAYLKKNGYQIVTTSPYGDRIQSLVTLSDRPVALVVGNETNGASEAFMQHADLTIQIPMQHGVESLNVGVATGISLYELKLKQVLGMIEKKIKSTLGREINVAARLIQDVLDTELKKVSDLSSAQLVFMMVLKCDTMMLLLDAQKQFGIPDQELASFFNPLQNRGLIIRDASDLLMITDSGVETIGKLWSIVENAEEKILDGFTEEEQSLLRHYIERLKNNCVDALKSSKS